MRRDIELQPAHPYDMRLPYPRCADHRTSEDHSASKDHRASGDRRASAHAGRHESSMDRVLRELLECEYLRGD